MIEPEDTGSPGPSPSTDGAAPASDRAATISYTHWQQVTVSIDDQHLNDIQTVATHLRDQGMHIDQILDGLGMITGSVPDQERSESVVHVTGVASVERQVTYQLPPPDADVQ